MIIMRGRGSEGSPFFSKRISVTFCVLNFELLFEPRREMRVRTIDSVDCKMNALLSYDTGYKVQQELTAGSFIFLLDVTGFSADVQQAVYRFSE